MGFFKIITKKSFWKIIAYGIALYVIVFIIVLLGLKIYTKHGRSFPVPDFKGLLPKSAIDVADARNLIIEVVDSTFIPYLPKGSIIEQYPKAGVNVKANRTVFLTINAFNQAKVKMPNVVGVSYRQGKVILERRGLKVGKLVYKYDFAKNNILGQKINGANIEPGTMVEKGKHIDLILGNGLSLSKTKIPNLIKYSYTRAVSEIHDAYFNVGNVIFDSSVKSYKDTMNALVWKQKPIYSDDNKAIMGSKLDVWLTLDENRFIEQEDE